MKKVIFDTFDEMAIVLEGEYNSLLEDKTYDDYPYSICVIADYDYINNLVMEFIKIDIPLHSAEFMNPLYDNYDGLFSLTLHEDGIDIEKMENIKYILDTELFIHSDNTDILNDLDIESNIVYSFEFSFDEEEDDKMISCDNHYECNEEFDSELGMNGFHFSRYRDGIQENISYYSNIESSIDKMYSLIRELYK